MNTINTDAMLDEAQGLVGPTSSAARGSVSSGVFRSGLWNIGGQGVTLLASLIATPFVVRLLSPRLYGLLALIESIIAYMAFANLGMAAASTRFGAAAFSRGDDEGEATVVWTCALMATVPVALAALLMSLAAPAIAREIFRLPARLQGEAVTAIRIASVGFVATALASCLNTSELIRLRWDIFTKIDAGGGALQVALVPVVLAFGGGIVAAVTVASSVAVAETGLHLVCGTRLQPLLRRPRIDLKLVPPLFRFGAALVVSSLTLIPLMNAERFILARTGSVSAVAYYSLAATAALLLTIPPLAICQPLLPAFTRLLSSPSDHREELRQLYTQALRGVLLVSIPAAVVLCVGARQAFGIWAGPAYGTNSTVPFYVLSAGLALGSLAYMPKNLLVASSRTTVLAGWHLAELPPYLLLAVVLTSRYGAVGAAMAWSIRVFIDAVIFLLLARGITGVSFGFLKGAQREYALALVLLVVPVAGALAIPLPTWAILAAAFFSLLVYSSIVTCRVLTRQERGTLSTAVRRMAALWLRHPGAAPVRSANVRRNRRRPSPSATTPVRRPAVLFVVGATSFVLGLSVVALGWLPALVAPSAIGLMALVALVRFVTRDSADIGLRRSLIRWTIAAFCVHLVISMVITSSSSAVNYFGPDAATYHRNATRIFAHWHSGSPMPHLPGGKEGFYYLLAGLYWVFGAYKWAGLAVNATLAAALVPIVADTTRRLFGPKAARFAPVLVVLVPGMVIWQSQLLKEAPILFLLAVAANCGVRLVDRVTGWPLLVLVVTLPLLLSFRGPVGVAVIAGVVLGVAIGKRDVAGGVTTSLAVVALLAVVLALGLGSSGYHTITDSNLSKAQLAHQDLSGSAASGFAASADISTPGGAISYLPRGVVGFAAGPLPWEIKGARQLVAVPDLLAWYFLLPNLWRGSRSARRIAGRRPMVLWLPALTITLLLSLVIGNYGTIVRERMQILVMLAPLIALGLSERPRAPEREKREVQLAAA